MKRILTILFVTSLLLSELIVAGPPVSHWEELAPYTGRNAYQKIDGALRQQMFLAIYDGLQKSYGGTVEGQLHENVVLLCAETSEFLYSHFTPTTVDYRQGSRPVLEATVEEVTADLVTEREKVLALLRYVRDITRIHLTQACLSCGEERKNNSWSLGRGGVNFNPACWLHCGRWLGSRLGASPILWVDMLWRRCFLRGNGRTSTFGVSTF